MKIIVIFISGKIPKMPKKKEEDRLSYTMILIHSTVTNIKEYLL